MEDSKKPRKILFVCLGNICRSPAAEGVMKSVLASEKAQGWTIDSAGTGDYHIGDLPDSRMRSAASRRGLDLTHRCRQVCQSDFEDSDLIIGMDANNMYNLRRMAPSAESVSKLKPMADFLREGCGYDYVPDPYYEGAEGFELVLDLLEDGCRNIYRAYK